MLGESSVRFVDARPFGQIVQALNVVLVRFTTTILVRAGLVEIVAQLQRRREQVDDLLGEDFGRASVLVDQGARTPQRMVDALLMGRVLETLVRRKTIVSHAAGPFDADDFFQNISTALRVDGVEGCSIITDPAMEPGGVPSDAPPRFIGSQMFRVDDSLLDLLVNGLEFFAGPENDLSTGTARE